MLVDYVDPAVLSVIQEKREDGTLALAAASLVILGFVLGVVALYDNANKSVKAKKHMDIPKVNVAVTEYE